MQQLSHSCEYNMRNILRVSRFFRTIFSEPLGEENITEKSGTSKIFPYCYELPCYNQFIGDPEMSNNKKTFQTFSEGVQSRRAARMRSEDLSSVDNIQLALDMHLCYWQYHGLLLNIYEIIWSLCRQAIDRQQSKDVLGQIILILSSKFQKKNNIRNSDVNLENNQEPMVHENSAMRQESTSRSNLFEIIFCY